MIIISALALLLGAAPPAFGEPLTVSSAVLTALAVSPELRQAQALQDIAASDVRLSRSVLHPQITLDASKTLWGFNEDDRKTTPSASGPENYSAEWTGTWKLLNGGGEWLTISERKRLRKAAAEAVQSARRQVEFTAVERFFALLEAVASVKVAEEHARLTQSQAELAKRLYERGARGRGDVLRAGISARQARIDAERAEASRSDALARLNAILGARPDRPLELAEPEEPISEPLPLEDYLAQARSLRPELRQARLELEAAGKARWRSRLDFLPAVTLGGTMRRRIDDPRVAPDPTWRVFAGVSVPVWDGLSRFESLRRASFDEDARRERLIAAERDAASEVSLARTALGTQAKIHALALEQVRTAQESLQFVAVSYRQGTASILELSDAQTQLVTLKQQSLQAFTAYHTAKAALDRATGKPWRK